MAAPGAMSERQLQKLLAEGKFPEVSQNERAKGRGKGTTSVSVPDVVENTEDGKPEVSESIGTTKPISGGRGKAKTVAKGKRKMDDDDYHDDVTTTTTPVTTIGREIVIDCFATINYLLRFLDKGRLAVLGTKTCCTLFTPNWSLFDFSFLLLDTQQAAARPLPVVVVPSRPTPDEVAVLLLTMMLL